MVGYTHHILQCGHNHQPVFRREVDYREYLMEMEELKFRLQVQVQGWCLFPERAHLLVSPMRSTRALGEFIKELAGRHTRHFNARYQHTGTPWGGRYRCSLVEPGPWQLACVRYLELLPVYQGLVSAPRQYPWSSYTMRLGGTDRDWLDRDAHYLSLDRDRILRRSLYRDYIAQGIDPKEREFIEAAVRRGQLTGSREFVDKVEALTGQRILFRGPGRPKKNK
tara:strand:- start:10896 stop:11564 length:669 start_codon:yes stop_codon:yes gene_type:complete